MPSEQRRELAITFGGARNLSHPKRIFIVGVVGIPNTYGGFEALAENLAKDFSDHGIPLTVFCEKDFTVVPLSLPNVEVERIDLNANGAQSVLYDFLGLIKAARRNGDVLLLGTAGTVFLPFIRILWPHCRVTVNIAGLEWKREKWGRLAKAFLRLSEWTAVKFAHALVTDNQGLSDYLQSVYSSSSVMIPYGGDQYNDLADDPDILRIVGVEPGAYDFALARAQPDNNLEMTLRAYAESGRNLVFVSNWASSTFGVDLRERYSSVPNLHLIGPFYEPERIQTLRKHARFYIHGHSAGGTNPTLVESMHSKLPILAFDVVFNRYTTAGLGRFFASAAELNEQVTRLERENFDEIGAQLKLIADKDYTWARVSASYRRLLCGSKV